jgi:hypothetical protein
MDYHGAVKRLKQDASAAVAAFALKEAKIAMLQDELARAEDTIDLLRGRVRETQTREKPVSKLSVASQTDADGCCQCKAVSQ